MAVFGAHGVPTCTLWRRIAVLAQEFPAHDSPEGTALVPPFDEYDPSLDDTRPSLLIILISAASGIAGGVVGLYFTCVVLGWDLPPSVFVAVLAMSLALGVAGAGLSALTGSRAALANIGFSCSLVLATTLFFGLCTLFGALGAALMLMRSQ